MSVSKINLGPIGIGNSRNITVVVTDKYTKLPVNISGDKFYFTVKNNAYEDDAEAVLQSSVIPSGAVAAAGKAIIPLTTAQTAVVEPGSYVYDIVWIRTTTAPGERLPVKDGIVSFEPTVTTATT